MVPELACLWEEVGTFLTSANIITPVYRVPLGYQVPRGRLAFLLPTPARSPAGGGASLISQHSDRSLAVRGLRMECGPTSFSSPNFNLMLLMETEKFDHFLKGTLGLKLCVITTAGA